MKTKLYIKYSSLILTLGLICFLAGPWAIGKYIKSSMQDRITLFKAQYPNFDIRVVEFKRHTYQSQALIEGSVKDSLAENEGKAIFKFSSKMNIQHGPFIWDKNHGLRFALAEMETQTTLEDTDYLRLDQKLFDTHSSISFRGIETFTLPIERFSGTLHYPNPISKKTTTFEFNFDNIISHISYSLNSPFPSYKIAMQAATIQNIQAGLIVNLDNFNVVTKQLNSSANVMIPDSEQHLTLNKCKIQSGEETFQIANIELQGNLISTHTSSIRNLRNNLSFKEANLNGIDIGESIFDFSVNNIPEKFFTTLTEIGRQYKSSEKNQKTVDTGFNSQEWQFDCIIHQLKIGLPGGDFLLHGQANLHSMPKNNVMDLEHSRGKIIALLPKRTIVESVKALALPLKMKPEDVNPGIQEISSMIQHSGFAIDTGEQYEIRLVYDKDFYFNGFTLKDTLAKHALAVTSIKAPMTADQELMMAIWSADLIKVKEILKRSQDKVNPELIFNDIKGPLQTAALMGQTEILHQLLQHRYNIDQPDFRGQTALFCAARTGQLDIAKTLIKKGASTNIKSNDGWTPLQEASENGHKAMVELLIQHKAEVNAVDNENRTALYWATKNNHKGIVEFLLSKGADRNITSNYGKKPIDVARQEGHTELAEMLSK